MARIEGLKQVEGLPTANFADDNAIGSVSQCGLQQIPYRYRRETALLMSGLEADQVAFANIQFSGVFNQQNPLFIWNRISQNIQQRRLTCSGSPADQYVLAIADPFAEKLRCIGA